MYCLQRNKGGKVNKEGKLDELDNLVGKQRKYLLLWPFGRKSLLSSV